MKRASVLAIVLLLAFVFAIAITAVSDDLAFNLFLGWLFFLARVVPEISPDSKTLLAAGVAILLFATGVHWLGRSWSARRDPVGPRWTIRASLIVTLMTLILFATATAMIGVIHQTGWLATSPQPLHATAAKFDGDSRNNLKWITLSMHNYESSSAGQVLPPAGTFAPDGVALHSWETHFLPWIGYDIRQVDKKLPWSHDKHAAIFRSGIHCFYNHAMPGATVFDSDGFAVDHYSANSQVLRVNEPMRINEIRDGTSNTIFVGEVNANFSPWGRPMNVRDPSLGINSSPHGFGGPRSQRGAYFSMGDGSVRFVRETVSPNVLRAMATPNGGETLEP